MVLAGCGQPVASSIGWTASENASGTAKPVVSISSSLPANVDRGVAANQKQATGDGDSKAVSVTGKAVASAPGATVADRLGLNVDNVVKSVEQLLG